MRHLGALVLAVTSAAVGDVDTQGPPTRLCSAGLDSSNTDLPIPTLAPPPAVPLASSRAARFTNRTSYRCSVRYGPAASAAVLGDHVNAQMGTMGWKLAERSADDSLVVSRYTGAASGVPLSAVTLVAALSGTPHYDVSVLIVRHEVVGDPRRQALPLLGRAGGGGAAARRDGAAVPATLDGLLRTALPIMGGGAYVEGTSMPPGFPAEILPKGTEVRLSASSDIHSTIVGVAPSLTVFELPAHFVSLRKSGWIGRGPEQGLGTDPHPQAVDLCRGSDRARLDFIPIPGGGFAIRARRSRDATTRCEPNAAWLSFDDVALPILRADGFRTIEVSGGGNGEMFDSQIHGHTVIGADTTAADLAAQLVKGGWTVAAQPRVGPVTVIRARSANTAGDPVTALLTITPLPESFQLNLWLRVVRHQPLPPPRTTF